MARIGQNPAKSIKSVVQPQLVTVAIVNYIPFLSGYYAQSLDVLKKCLGSIWEHTKYPYDLLVFDNGSCSEVRDYLIKARNLEKIQYLVLSEKNIGKSGAWNFIFGAAPGEFIAYADSDVYFYPGWLEPQIDILKIFPNAGMVTGMPLWSPEEYSTSTIRWAEENSDIRLEKGKLLPWEYYWRHARSLGREKNQARNSYQAGEDIVIYRDDVRYYVGAAHFQFVSRKEILKTVLPIPSRKPMGEVRLLDIALNEKGYLRLSTEELWVQHMGNILDPKISLQKAKSHPIRNQSSTKIIWNIKPVKKLLQWFYHRIFEILYEQ
jgi:glycosyltransferase involved in cell wall biosynthesis